MTGWVSPTLTGEIFAEPLIFNGAVYAATLDNMVYALNQATGAVIWSNSVGAPQTSGWVCGNISPTGILGTPVIDTAANRIYVVAEITGATPTYHLFGLDLANSGNIVLDTAIAPTGFDWSIQQQRGALSLHGGFVYVPFGGRLGDCGSYNGWVVGVPTSGSTTLNVYKTADLGSGLWGAGGLAIDDATGNVFGATGNGVAGGCNTTGQNDAVVKLSPTLALLDWFMPQDWQNNWCLNDQDLGSAGPLLLGSKLLFQAGKRGGGFLLNTGNLGHVNGQVYPPPTNYTQADVCHGNLSDATFGSFAYAAPFVYVECEGGGLVALNVNTGTPSFTPCSASPCGAPDWSAGGATTFGPPIVAGGAVWVASGNGLTAFDMTTGTQIYQSAAFGVNRFVTPAEAGGQVFVPSHTVVRSFNMTLLNWTSLGGTLTSSPDASSSGANAVNVFVRGTDNALWYRTWNGTTWSAWATLGGTLTADPSSVSQGANSIDVFARGTDNGIWHRNWNGTTWSLWDSVGGIATSSPDAASWGANRLDLVVRGTDYGLWHRSWNGTAWGAWDAVGGYATSDPSLVASGTGRVDVFVRGTDNSLWHRTGNGSGTWGAWDPVGGLLTSGPDAASCSAGRLDVFVRGTDNGLWQRGFNGTSWGTWTPWGAHPTADVGVVCPPGTISVYVFARGTDNGLWQTTVTGS
jgi:outer membrane protein assembly factor BamB